MDLSENRNQHPNMIASAVAHQCVIGATTYDHSIIIPSNEAIIKTTIQSTTQLHAGIIDQLVAYTPEVIILATGQDIVFPDTELLSPLIKHNIGLEVLNNPSAARTFNVLLSENRQTVCLMMIGA